MDESIEVTPPEMCQAQRRNLVKTLIFQNILGLEVLQRAHGRCWLGPTQVTRGKTAGQVSQVPGWRCSQLRQVVALLSPSISWGAFCNKDARCQVPVCQTNRPTTPRPRQPWQHSNPHRCSWDRPGLLVDRRHTHRLECDVCRGWFQRCNRSQLVMDDRPTSVTHLSDSQGLIVPSKPDITLRLCFKCCLN